MKEEYYQIGEVSRITGISKDTLHFYTKIGLVTPDYINPENHYHYYSRWNMYQFHFIGLNVVWWTFSVTEIIASTTGILIIMILHKQDSVL